MAATDGKKRRPPVYVKAYVSAEEKAGICAAAARLRMPVSEYVRRVMTRFEVPASKIDADAIDKLMKVNANLARLGNSQRQKMDILGASAVSREWIEATAELEREIRETQAEIRACVLEIRGGYRERTSG